MDENSANQREEEEMVKKAREVMYQIKSHFRIKFGCQVTKYLKYNYGVRFSEGDKVVWKDIPRKYMEDQHPEKSHTDYWEKLFNMVEEELNSQKGGKPNP